MSVVTQMSHTKNMIFQLKMHTIKHSVVGLCLNPLHLPEPRLDLVGWAPVMGEKDGRRVQELDGKGWDTPLLQTDRCQPVFHFSNCEIGHFQHFPALVEVCTI